VDLVLEFMAYIEREPNATADRLFERILEKSRLLTGAEAGTIFLVEETEPTAPRIRPICIQNNLVEVGSIDLTLAIGPGSLAGYVAQTGEVVIVDDTYDQAKQWPFSFDHAVDKRIGYRTVSILAFPIRTYAGSIVGVVELINRRKLGHQGPAPFDREQADMILAFNQLVGRAIERTVLIDELKGASRAIGVANRALAEESKEREAAEDQAVEAGLEGLETVRKAGERLRAHIVAILDAAGRGDLDAIAKTAGTLKTALDRMVESARPPS
jgi:GAF domain-containing protein